MNDDKWNKIGTITAQWHIATVLIDCLHWSSARIWHWMCWFSQMVYRLLTESSVCVCVNCNFLTRNWFVILTDHLILWKNRNTHRHEHTRNHFRSFIHIYNGVSWHRTMAAAATMTHTHTHTPSQKIVMFWIRCYLSFFLALAPSMTFGWATGKL